MKLVLPLVIVFIAATAFPTEAAEATCENFTGLPQLGAVDRMCRYLKDILSRNLGPEGAHCTHPQSTYHTAIMQSVCAKTCCQCQGTLRCPYYDPSLLDQLLEGGGNPPPPQRSSSLITMDSKQAKLLEPMIRFERNIFPLFKI